jgi:hypothetical protein
MPEPRTAIARQLNASQVLLRFALRFVLLAAFATLSTQGFAVTFTILLVLSAIFCAVTAAMRREPMLSPALTHWDEAAATSSCRI